MELQQILILVLCVEAVHTFRSRCFNETDLNRVAQKKLKKFYPQPINPPPSKDSPTSCPVDRYQKMTSSDENERSLSPWKYVTVSKPDYYPHTYTEAKCLCSGCILVLKNGTAIHSSDYNTTPLIRTWVFLKRDKEGCGNGMYRLVPENMKVSMGCTCVRAKTVSS